MTDSNNRRILALALIFMAGFFSLLRHGISYTDDNIRIITGDSLFLYSGRPLTEWLVIGIHGGTPLFDSSPLPQILAILVLVAVSLAFANRLTGYAAGLAIVAGACVGMNPMIIENMAYKFDALPMVLALAIAMLPMFLKSLSGYRYFLLCSASALASLMLYQAAVGAFIAVVAGDYLRFILLNNSMRDNIRRTAIAIMGLGFASILYKLSVEIFFKKYMDGTWGGQNARISEFENLFPTVLNNINAYIVFLDDNLASGYFNTPFLASIVFALVAILTFYFSSRPLSQSLLRLPFLLVGLLVLFLAPLGIQVVLTSPVLHPRSLYGFGVVLAVLLSLALRDEQKKPVQYLIAAPFVAIIFCSLISASLLGNMQQQQARWEAVVISGLANDISDVAPNDGPLRVRFVGALEYAPEVRVGLINNPLLRYVARYHVGDIWSFPALLSSLGLAVEIVKSDAPAGPIIKRGLGYSISRDSDGVLSVRFQRI